jgi:hypothetical protein
MGKAVYPAAMADVIKTETVKGKAFDGLGVVVYDTSAEMVADAQAGNLVVGQECICGDEIVVGGVHVFKFFGTGFGRMTWTDWTLAP